MQTNVRWPAPVDQRLNELVERIGDLGFETSRSLVLAALVASAPIDLTDLEKMIRGYRSKTAGGVVLQRRGPILLRPRRPGRRSR